jgi:hypothetical protein
MVLLRTINVTRVEKASLYDPSRFYIALPFGFAETPSYWRLQLAELSGRVPFHN